MDEWMDQNEKFKFYVIGFAVMDFIFLYTLSSEQGNGKYRSCFGVCWQQIATNSPYNHR